MFIHRDICSVSLTRGEQDVLMERQSHFRRGYSDEHDARHHNDELTLAAVAYLLCADMNGKAIAPLWPNNEAHATWPFPLTEWNPKTRRQNLIRGIALALAELDRLDAESVAQERAAARNK